MICECCEGGEFLLKERGENEKGHLLKRIFWIEGKSLKSEIYNILWETEAEFETKINYCPKCGKKL
jgi:uncharacterized protein with PIN domain